MSTIAQNHELLKHLVELVQAHRRIFRQERVYHRVVALVFGLLFCFGRGTMTQVLMALGLTETDWSSWYRLFSQSRFDADKASEVMVEQCLKHIEVDALLVLGADSTQTPCTSRKIEGTGYIRNLRTPPFMVGVHLAQRWFNFSLLLPAVAGFSRALPLRLIPAFTPNSYRQHTIAYTEWQAAVLCLHWLFARLTRLGRTSQKVLLLGDGSYDTLALWQQLPAGITLLIRTAKNRVLHHLPAQDAHKNRKYGQRAQHPQAIWRDRKGWKSCTLVIRGHQRKLRFKFVGPVLRCGAPDTPLFLIVVGGAKYTQHGKGKQREPIAYLVNAVLDTEGNWCVALPVDTLLFWAWQRWELEVCHRELKSNFGLGEMQCSNPVSAVICVQFVAWVYALLLLAGYRTWGLCGSPDVPTRWWHGARRWSFNTLWRSYRAALWASHDFRPLYTLTADDWARKETVLAALANSIYASVRL